MGQHFEAIIVGIVLVFIIISLYKEILGPVFTFFIGIVVLGICGILTPKEILSGFANEQIYIIIMLLLLGEAMRQISVIEVFFKTIFPRNCEYKGYLGRVMIWVGGLSAFLNNTPLVAVMMPQVSSWCKRNNISPSKVLMPLSYAAILGGCVTLIGTSTNLIVAGMVTDQKIFPDMEPLKIFDFFWVGFPMLIIGFFYLLFFSDKLLNKKNTLLDEVSRNEREYTIEANVRKNSKLKGTKLKDLLADENHLKVDEMIREGVMYQPDIDGEILLQEDDVVVISGDSEDVANLVTEKKDFVLPNIGMMSRLKRSEVVEIVISQDSAMVSKTVGEINFRGQYDASLLAIHRNGERIKTSFDDVRIKGGDALLLLVGKDFEARNSGLDFYLISKVREVVNHEPYKNWTLFGGTLLAILLSALNIVPLFMGLLVVLVIVTLLNVVNAKDLPRRIDYNLAVTIALSLALGTAMTKTGVAEMISNLLVEVLFPFGTVVVLFGIYLVTAVLAAYITNKAAVAIVFPISLTAAQTLGLPPLPFALVVSFAAAANFLTPIGYQTNLMVYGPGGYSFKDFFKLGLPLTLIYMVVCVSILNYLYL